jgi:ubiquinone/menaquinone biosynthesis C-methylase UbiE
LLLRDAIARGSTASGIDHSHEMVHLARERAPGAEVALGRAEALPFVDGAFTAVTMSIVFFFLEHPVAALRECRRVLGSGGRLAVYTTSPALRGTPAAPEPLASRGHFYEDEQLGALAREAGFEAVSVRDDHGGQLLTAGVGRD